MFLPQAVPGATLISGPGGRFRVLRRDGDILTAFSFVESAPVEIALGPDAGRWYHVEPADSAEEARAARTMGEGIVAGWRERAEERDAMRREVAEMIASHRRDPGDVQVLPVPALHVLSTTPDAAALTNWFRHHAPVADQADRYEAIRAAGLRFARAIVACAPPGPDLDEALKLARSAVFWANAAVACSPPESLPMTARQEFEARFTQKPPEPDDVLR